LVTDFLAERLCNNIRELEGGLNRVFAYSEITQRPLSVELAQQALPAAYLDEKSTPSSPSEIIGAVSEYFNMEYSSLTGPRGRKEVALARQIAMHLIKTDTNLGPTAIGQALGGKNHSTVIKNCAKISQKLNTDLTLQRDISNIRNLISS
jgi:chromosomal replication initiator protein